MAHRRTGSALSAEDYVHLHNHTQYSLLDGLTKIPALLDFIEQSGMKSVAITDHGTLSGAIEFYKEAMSRNLKPIIGMETYVAARRYIDKDPAKDKTNYHLTILAMNNQGYQNLMRLSTIANLDGYYYKPRVDRELLERYNEGLIVLSGCIGGEVGDLLRQDQYEAAKAAAAWYKSVFKDRYFLEVQDHGHPKHPTPWAEQTRVNEQLFRLADELAIPAVVTCDAHYLRHEDQEAHEVLLCVQTGSFMADENRMSLKDMQLHVTDPLEVITRWGTKHPEVITNTKKIAEMCDVQLELGKILIPQFPVPEGETELTYLEKLVYKGLARRYGGKSDTEAAKLTVAQAKKSLPKQVAQRAKYELDVIEQMGFCGYFLIIADFINWGKDNGIVFGPGRGSAAGSIISYALKITELDPLQYGLLFERFLNPDRISMPDIDIDIQDSRRDEVIQYCIDKYGGDRVANIVTFGRMAARNAVRDVARVLQVPYAEADRLAKMIPPPIQGRHIPLAKSLREQADLAAEYRDSEAAKRVFDLAMQLEGTIRSHGVHAAGVVIAPDDIVKFVPLEKAQKGVIATQYSMGPIEDLGLLKMDFLGLSNLTIIKNALRIVKKVYRKNLDINQVPLDDKKTFELLQRGETTGVFQFESAGMKRYLKELKPTLFDDIIAMGALYRPGPLTAGLTDKFIARKNGREKVVYDHKLMEPALRDTYGVMVYQEQFMQIARDMCGFSGGESDTLRKAVGKKKRDLMAKMKDQIIQGAIKNGVDQTVVEKFWKDLEGFADYAFNKSHAACYGLISYQTAYLKAHYPAAFMAALMTSDYDNTDRLAIEITECKHMGIEVLPPDINESFVEFAVVPKTNQIRFGMAAIKNVGTAAVEEIIRAREALGGTFVSLEDFFANVNLRVVNRKTLESLVKSGAFDKFEERGKLLDNLDVLLAYASRLQKQTASGQTDLFGEQGEIGTKPTLRLMNRTSENNDREFLQWERELLGLYLSQHPLAHYETLLAEQTVAIDTLTPDMDGKTVRIGGLVADCREVTTKNGQKMAFVKLADMNDEIEIVLFPTAYQQTLGMWERDKVVLVKGKVTSRNKDGSPSGELKVIADEAREVTPEQAAAYRPTGKKPKPPTPRPSKSDAKPVPLVQSRVYIRMENSEDQGLLLSLKQTIDAYRGETEVVLVLGSAAQKQAIRLPMKINQHEEALELLRSLVGPSNVKVQ